MEDMKQQISNCKDQHDRNKLFGGQKGGVTDPNDLQQVLDSAVDKSKDSTASTAYAFCFCVVWLIFLKIRNT